MQFKELFWWKWEGVEGMEKSGVDQGLWMDGVNHSARSRSTYQGAGFPPGYKQHTHTYIQSYSEGGEEHRGWRWVEQGENISVSLLVMCEN